MSEMRRASVIKSLWASVQGDPVFMRRVNGWLTMFWIVMIPVSVVTGLVSSVAYVSALSLWALVSGHWSAWQAARVEVAQQEQAEKAEADPVEDRVVDKIVRTTDVNLTQPEASTNATSTATATRSTATAGDSDLDALLVQLDNLRASLRSVRSS